MLSTSDRGSGRVGPPDFTERSRPAAERALHGALARALASHPRSAQADIARHFDAAELREEALAAYQQAGDRALVGLAFQDSAHHFGRAIPIWVVEILAGETINARHLRRSVAAGDAAHVARALVTEAVAVARRRPEKGEKCRKLFERARTLYTAAQDPALEVWVLVCEGSVFTCRNEPAMANEKRTLAEALLRGRCPDEPWLLTLVRSGLGFCWFQLGQSGGQLTRLDGWLSEAAERDDRFARAILEAAGLCSLRFLPRDEPVRVGEQLEQALAPWPPGPWSRSPSCTSASC